MELKLELDTSDLDIAIEKLKEIKEIVGGTGSEKNIIINNCVKGGINSEDLKKSVILGEGLAVREKENEKWEKQVSEYDDYIHIWEQNDDEVRNSKRLKKIADGLYIRIDKEEDYEPYFD